MALVDSLLTAIVRADGDALVMHVGERPYVVASAGPLELSTHALNLGAMEGMLGQLLPGETQRALQEFGAIEYELEGVPAMGGDRFTVVAARGGDDIWIEMRRHRRMKPASGIHRAAAPTAVVAPVETPPVAPVAAAPPAAVPMVQPADVRHVAAVPLALPPAVAEVQAPALAQEDVPVPMPPPPPMAPPAYAEAADLSASALTSLPDPVTEPAVRPVPVVVREPLAVEAPEALAAAPVDPLPSSVSEVDGAAGFRAAFGEDETASEVYEVQAITDEDLLALMAPAVVDVPEPAPLVEETADLRAPRAEIHETPEAEVVEVAEVAEAEEPRDFFAPPTVVPIRAVARPDAGPRLTSRPGGLERLLRLTAARGATALYLTSQSPPAIRVDGEVLLLAGEPALTSADVEAAVLEILPEGSSDGVRRGEITEWIVDLADIGRVRCTTFRDHRGPGVLLRMISARAASAEQLGLSREIQALATEPEGLVLVSGPRGSGKSTLVAAMVDLVNRQRADYVITLERQIRLVHEHRHSLISQREVRGHGDEVVAAARAALRENPDVLVIEDLRSPDVLQVALDAAGSGLLVVVSVTASATTAAIERLVDMVSAERRTSVQASLAETLRGAVSQVLLRKTGGGRLAARELLLSTSAVAGLVAEGQIAQLPRAIDSGRKHGMVPLNDALVAFVQSGAVDVREAYRKASDRTGLLAQLKREGIDTSFVERLA